jgi:hypothetical protein
MIYHSLLELRSAEVTKSEQSLLNLKEKYRVQVLKAIGHLDYSYKKSVSLPMLEKDMDEEILETWEGFSSRFARVLDLYTTKYLKICVVLSDPAFDGSYRDLLDAAEKLRLIESADLFMKMREIRNIHAHDYRDDKLQAFLTDLQTYTPHLLKIRL